MSEGEIKVIRLDLEKEPNLKKDIEAIREYYRIGNYKDAVRIAISEMARIVRKHSITTEVT